MWQCTISLLLGLILVIALASMAMAASVGCSAINAGALNYSGQSLTYQSKSLLLTGFAAGDILTYTHTTTVPRPGVTLTVGTSGTLNLTQTTTSATTTVLSGPFGALLGADLLNLNVTVSSADPQGKPTIGAGNPIPIVVTVTCAPAPSATTMVVTSTSPTVVGQAGSVSATVVSGLTPATGSVIFTVDGVAQPAATLNGSGVATISMAGRGAKNYTVGANFAGNSTFAASNGTLAGGYTVLNALTATALASSSPTATYASNVTFTATTSAVAPGGGVPAGSVIFSVDGADKATVALDGSGSATYATNALAVGVRAVAARFVATTDYAASTAAIVETITRASTTTTVTQTAATTTYGDPVTFRATLASPAGTPTGNVTFSIDNIPQSPVALVSGVAELTKSDLAPGNHIISASYADTTTLSGSTGTLSGGHAVTVIGTTTAVSGPATVVYGNNAVLTATVSAASGTPTGSITFTVDNVARAPVALSGGSASLSLSNLAVGTHSVSADYSGATNFGTSSGALSGGVAVTKAATTTTINPITTVTLGQAVNLSATVASLAGTPTGTVTFTVGGVAQDPVPLIAGQANLLVTNLGVGTKVVTAAYSGADNYAVSSTASSVTINKAASTLAVTSANNPAVTGQALSFTATASAATGTPTGAVTFTVDGVTSAPITLSNGVATFNRAALPLGVHIVSASYEGDASVNASAAILPGGQTVGPAATTVAVSSDAASPALGTAVTFTAHVAPVAPGAGTPTGAVIFSIDGVAQAPVTLSGGNGTISRSSLGVGNHAVTALYVGDGDFNSASGTLSGGQTVVAAATTTSLSFSPANPSYGSIATLTATVSSANAVPAGTVIFTVNGTDRPATALINGVATLLLTDLDVRDYALGARFVATTSYLASTAANRTMTVAAAPTTTAIIATPGNIQLGDSVTLTATVASLSGIPTGDVQFRDGATVLGTATLSNGLASLSTSALGSGNHTITANYLGSTNHGPSSATLGAPLTILPGNTLMVLAALPQPATYGQTVTLSAVTTALSGTPTGNVVFTVDGNAKPPVALSNGVASLAINNFEPGTHTVSASYAGTADHTATTATLPGGVLVTKAVPAIALTATPSAPNFGDAVTATATLTSPAGTPNGDVVFVVDGASRPAVTTSSGVASIALPNLSAGPHVIEARFAGDAHFTPAAMVLASNVSITAATTSMTLSASPDPANFGAPVTFTANVTSSAGTPSGQVVFSIDAQPQAPVTLSNGTATLTTSGLTVGPHVITASYAAQGNYGPSFAALVGGIDVDVATTTTTVAPPSSAVAVGGTARFTATVSAANGTPSGSVVFTVDGLPQAPVALNNGSASIDQVFQTAGAHAVTATYAGAANFAPSTGLTSFVIDRSPSTLVLSVPATSEFGAPVTVSAIATSAIGIPSGTVSFAVDGTIVGSGVLMAGSASLVLPQLSAGSHAITASYAGDLNIGASTAPAKTIAVGVAPTDTTINATPTTVSTGQPTIVTITVSAASDHAPATGNVTIRIGTVDHTVPLINGVATLVVSDLDPGTYGVSASYPGAANFAASTAVLGTNLVVEPPPTDIHVTGVLPRAVQGLPFVGAVTAYGGVAPYNYTVTGGTAPAGLSLNAATGAITGTPTAAGTYNWQITATGTGPFPGAPGVYNATLVVLTPATITLPANLAPAVYGESYVGSVAATGGTGQMSYAVTAGALPQGISLDPSTGGLSGVSTQLGISTFTISATDSNGFVGTRLYTMGVTAPPILVTGAFPSTTAGRPYSATAVAIGGTMPYGYSVTGTLPAGLVIDQGTGTVSGTPTTAGSYNFAIKATDANGFSGSLPVTLEIDAQPVIVLPSTLAVPRQNRAYSQALAASGGMLPYTYSVSSGALPAGISLNTVTGRLSGTPTGNGISTFEITARDLNNVTGTHSYTLDVLPAAVLVVDTNVGTATAGTVFDKTIGVTGGTAPYTFSLVSGALPPGIAMLPNGRLLGTSVVPGTYNFVVDVADALGDSVTSGITLQAVPPAITVSATLVNTNFGTGTTGTVLATGGSGSFTYSATGLPAGVSINANTGIVTGTATEAGTFHVVFTAKDSNNFTGTTATDLTITPPTVTLNALPLQFLLGIPLNTAITASGGTAPYHYALSGNLPAGLTFNTTTGALTGIPLSIGPRTFTITATDANGFVGQADYTVGILTNIGTAVLPVGVGVATAGSLYSASVAATSGGALPLTYAVTTGQLPTGMTLNASTGEIRGTTTAVGAFPIVVTARGTDNRVNSSAYTLVVLPPVLSLGIPLGAGVAGTPYSDSINVLGGVGPYVVTVNPADLPAGLSVGADGTVSGTPTEAGNFSFVAHVRDNNLFTVDLQINLNIAAPTIVMTNTVALARVGQPYSSTVSATGGVAPRSYAVTSGTLPDGLTLNGATGLISGTPTTATISTVTITATDANGFTGAHSYEFIVATNLGAAILGALDLPIYNVPYSDSVAVTGSGTPPYTYAVTTGTLPGGLSLNASTGAITGTPTTPGAYSFTITATDSTGLINLQTYNWNIAAPLIGISLIPTAGQVGTPYSSMASASGGIGPYSYAMSGAAPGLTINAATGEISGTPTAAGLYNFTVTATDRFNYSSSTLYTMVIAPAPIVLTLPGSLPDATEGVPYSVNLTPLNAVGAVTLALTGGTQLPAGLTLDANTGIISGTPTLDGTFSFGVNALDALGNIGTIVYNLVVSPDLPDLTSIVLNAGATTAVIGQPVTVSTTVSTLAGLVGQGTVSIIDDSTGSTLATAAVGTDGTANFNLTFNTLGARKLLARYSGTLAMAASEILGGTITVNPAATSLSLSGTTGTITAGTSASLVANVTRLSPALGVAGAGEIHFYVDGTEVEVIPATGGSASFVAQLSPGRHVIRARFLSLLGIDLGSEMDVTIDVTTNTTTTVAVPTADVVQGSTATYTATVTPEEAGLPLLLGLVTFRDNGAIVGIAPMVGGTATFSAPVTTLGNHDITASYSGDVVYGASTSNIASYTVVAPPSAPRVSTTTLLSSSGSPQIGDPLVLTATVEANGSIVPTGIVTFVNSTTGIVLGTAPLDSSGVARLTLSTIDGAQVTFRANYPGDTRTLPSSGTTLVVPIIALTTTTLSSSALTVLPGDTVTLTANVQRVGGGQPDAGTVVFRAGTVAFAYVDTNGNASVTTTTAPMSDTTVFSAQFIPGVSSTDMLSISNPVTVLVAKAVPSVIIEPTLNSDGSASGTVKVRAPTGVTRVPSGDVVIRATNGPAQTVTLANGEATFSYPPSSLPIAGVVFVGEYGGDTYFTQAVGLSATLSAGTTLTQSTLSLSSNQIMQGETVVATVAVSATSAVNEGSVQFYVNGTLADTAAVSNGTASVTLANLNSGQNVVTAQYGGSASFAPSLSNAASVNVVPLPTGDLSIDINANTQALFSVGQVIHLDVVVGANGAAAANVVVTGNFITVCVRASLNAGETMSCSGNYVVTEMDMRIGSVSFQANAVADGMPAVSDRLTLQAQDEMVSQAFEDMGEEFVADRARSLATAIPLPNILLRRYNRSGARAGTVEASGDGSSQLLAFSSSLQEWRDYAAVGAAEALAMASPQEAELLPVNIWVDAQFSVHADSRDDDSWGQLGTVAMGADFLISKDIMAGVMVQGDFAHEEATGSEISGTGYLIGPYISIALGENLSFDATVMYGQSFNKATSDILGETFSGEFNTTRLSAKASLTGFYEMDQLTIRPNATFYLGQETIGAYTVSNEEGAQVAVPGGELLQYRLTVGSTFEYQIALDDGAKLTPMLGVDVGITGNSQDGGEVTQTYVGRVTAGVEYETEAGLIIGLEFSTELDSGGFSSSAIRASLKGRF